MIVCVSLQVISSYYALFIEYLPLVLLNLVYQTLNFHHFRLAFYFTHMDGNIKDLVEIYIFNKNWSMCDSYKVSQPPLLTSDSSFLLTAEGTL